MSIKFTKMHGLGNDFMVIDGVNQPINLHPKQIAQLAQRHTGVGFDQLLLIEAGQQQDIDFTYRIFNADGQEVGQCGNGARCLAAFARYYGLTTKNHIKVATRTTQMDLYIEADNLIRVDMGIPKLAPAQIPVKANEQATEYQLPLANGESISFYAINVGNPHAVLLVDTISTAPVMTLGQQISVHPNFPDQVNVGFMQLVNSQHIRLRVYERGCGETQACGSGAVAAAAIGRLYHSLDKKITVSLPGGDLIIEWPAFDQSITLTGPATFVYEGLLFS